jgi:hypothetical protein
MMGTITFQGTKKNVEDLMEFLKKFYKFECVLEVEPFQVPTVSTNPDMDVETAGPVTDTKQDPIKGSYSIM